MPARAHFDESLDARDRIADQPGMIGERESYLLTGAPSALAAEIG